MQIDVVNIDGKKVGADRPRRRRLRRRGQRAPPLGGGQGAAGRQARRHPLDQDARRGARRRQEAVEAEGDRQRAPGLDAGRRSSSAAARCSARSRATTPTRCRKKVKRAALRLGAVAARQGEEAGRSSTQFAVRRAQDQDGWPASSRRWALDSALIVDGKSNVNLSKSVRNLARVQVPRPRGPQRLRHPQPPEPGDRRRRRQSDRGARPGEPVEPRRRPRKEQSCVHQNRSSSARCSPRRATRLKRDRRRRDGARPMPRRYVAAGRVRGRARRQQGRDSRTRSRSCGTST